MAKLQTDSLIKSIKTLESSLEHLLKVEKNSIEFEIFRNATVKGFELTLETAGKLLRKALKAYSGDPRAIDALTYKEVLRLASKHTLLNSQAVKRWFQYRDNRNDVAHDYGVAFANTTLKLLPEFLNDVRALEAALANIELD